MYLFYHWLFLPVEVSALLKTAKILAIETSEAEVKPEWLYFVMRKNIVLNLKSFKHFNS